MKRKGVSYDVGRVMGFNWCPHFKLGQVHRELEIIKDDLHCNSVRICGLDLRRLMAAAEDAMNQGLEVWLSPELWDRTPQETLDYLTKAARAAEGVRQRWPDRMVFSVGSELTLFMQGILEGKSFRARLANPSFIAKVKAGEHNKPLNDFLAKANKAVRSEFHGQVTYASLVWEAVDWSGFDLVGVDHYRTTKIRDQYIPMLVPSFKHGKPVVITEFGYATTHGGIGDGGMLLSSAGLEKSLINETSQALHFMLPGLGRFIRPRLNGVHVRDEAWQAAQLTETLDVLNCAGVDGAFIFQFASQITPYDANPKYDLDMASSSLVRYFEGRRRGTTYPEMPWEPKESFKAVASYYANQ